MSAEARKSSLSRLPKETLVEYVYEMEVDSDWLHDEIQRLRKELEAALKLAAI